VIEKSAPQTIDVQSLTKSYGARTVVDSVSLDVRAGEVVGLLGPNGAGKTTTFYMVVGLVRPNSGAVVLTGRDGSTTDITHQPIHVRAREGLGYLAQETSVFRRLSVADNLRLIWEQRGVEPLEQERRLPLLLEEFGLQSLAGATAETLSGGERRRVEIARAIATDPAFLLLDEPFTGIDPIAVADIQEIIRLLRAKGLGVLITDHAVRETLAIVDRAYILNRGRIEVSGTASEVAESPVARQFYLGESFRL
jgi:lipopolysaccharide export system ATP-binding protein